MHCEERRFFDVVHPEDVSLYRKGWESALATGDRFEVETRVLLKVTDCFAGGAGGRLGGMLFAGAVNVAAERATYEIS